MSIIRVSYINFIVLFIVISNNAALSQIDSTNITYNDTLKSSTLKEINVVAERYKRKNNLYQFSPKNTQSLVSIIGINDPIRYIGTLPGVSQGMEGGLSYYIRGGNNSNNLILLDEVPVYGNTHLFGLLSSLHSDIVETINFRSGNFDGNENDFLSSVLEIQTVTPKTKNTHGGFDISPFAIGASLNGKIGNTKLKYLAAGRISLLQPELKLITSSFQIDGEINPQFADFYGKIDYKIDSINNLVFNGYYSNDYFAFQSSFANIELNWGNYFIRTNWSHTFNPNLQLISKFYINRFKSAQRQRYYEDGGGISYDLKIQTLLHEQLIGSELLYKKNNISINGGVKLKLNQCSPAAKKVLAGQDEINTFQNKYSTTSFILFGDIKYQYKKINLHSALRGMYYSAEEIKKILSDITINVAYIFTKNYGVEFSYDLMSQTHHTVEGLPLGWSIDLQIPAIKKLIPERSSQIYAGSYWVNNMFTVSSGLYYRTLKNLVSYKNSTNIFGVQNTSWEEEVCLGQGKSYGLETRIEKRGDKWNSTLSYTLSKTTRQYNDINNGKIFPFSFDRRHILNFTSQLLTRKKNNGKQYFNTEITFSSGHYTTLAIAVYEGIELPYWNTLKATQNYLMYENMYSRQEMSSINGVQLPNYFRIDIGYSFYRKYKKHESDFTIGFYNVLNRKNPYLIFYDDRSWKQLSILPIIPTISYKISF